MVHHEEFDVNKAQLPRLLPKTLLKLHLIKISIGICLIILGVVAMSIYDVSTYAVVLGAGITSFFAGFFGSTAGKLRSLVLHGGSVLVFALSFYMSLLAYVGFYTIFHLNSYTMEIIVFLVNLLLLVMDMIFSALNGGVELIVIYVAESQRRLAIEEKRRETSAGV